MTGQEIVTVVLAAVTFLSTCIISLVALIYRTDRQETKEQIAGVQETMNKQLEQVREMAKVNGKHLDSLIHTSWLHTWRINGMEDYLSDKTDFRPPRIIGTGETREDKEK